MKVLITSDTHGRYSVLEKIASLHKDKDLHIDAGDLLLTQKELESLKLTAVKGNTDHFLELPLQQIVTIDDKKWLIVHGHVQNVKYGLEKLVSYANTLQVEYVVYGHTHEPKLIKIDGITYLNPGAVSNIRPQYALYEDGKITLIEGL